MPDVYLKAATSCSVADCGVLNQTFLIVMVSYPIHVKAYLTVKNNMLQEISITPWNRIVLRKLIVT
jgi:hypothetical protein